MANGTYTKKSLLKALMDAGLPHDYSTLIEYEKRGFVPIARRIQFSERSWRIYTADEIQDIVEKVRANVASKKKR